MNTLNSVILEGTASINPVVKTLSTDVEAVNFLVTVERKIMLVDGTIGKENFTIDVECYGNVADAAKKFIKKGRGVRVVGYLKQETITGKGETYYSRIFVVAEHLELKPIHKKEK